MVSASGLMEELKWLNLQEKRTLHGLVLLHKLLQGKGPGSLTEEVQELMMTGSRVTRGLDNINLTVTHTRTNYGKKTFLGRLTGIWNKIPGALKKTTSSQNFKEKLYQYMLVYRGCLHHGRS